VKSRHGRSGCHPDLLALIAASKLCGSIADCGQIATASYKSKPSGSPLQKFIDG
jgi:hypothetical protein